MPLYAWKGINAARQAGHRQPRGGRPQGAAPDPAQRERLHHRVARGGGGPAEQAGGGRVRQRGQGFAARGRHQALVRARARAGCGDLHPPARDLVARGDSPGRGAGGAGRAVGSPQAADDPGRHPPEGERGQRAGRCHGRARRRVPRTLRQHGPLGRERRQPGRRAGPHGQLPRLAERAALQGDERDGLSHPDGHRRHRLS